MRYLPRCALRGMNGVETVMEACVWCMQPAFAVVARVLWNLLLSRSMSLRRLRLILFLSLLIQLPSRMDHRSGHVHRTLKGLPEQISLSRPMGRCVVQQAALSIHKSAERSIMARMPSALCSADRPLSLVSAP